MTPVRYIMLAAIFALCACGSEAQERRDARTDAVPANTRAPDAAKKGAPPKPLSADAEAPTGEPKEKANEKDQRGNTPPGTARSGAKAAEGAIVDPAGVTKK